MKLPKLQPGDIFEQKPKKYFYVHSINSGRMMIQGINVLNNKLLDLEFYYSVYSVENNDIGLYSIFRRKDSGVKCRKN